MKQKKKKENDNIQIDKRGGLALERECVWCGRKEWGEGECNCTPAESPLEFIVFTGESVQLDLLTWSTLLLTRNIYII